MLGLIACSDYDFQKEEPEVVAEAPTDSATTPATTVEEEPCEGGYLADYYNLPADHPDVEGEPTGLVPGDLPENHDWWDEAWYVRTQVDEDLAFGTPWWPVDEGEAGDPLYYAVHWQARITATEDQVHAFELGSDDDSWAIFDGELVADLGGIHGVEAEQFLLSVTRGSHRLDLYMAERHSENGGFWFRWLTTGLVVEACEEPA